MFDASKSLYDGSFIQSPYSKCKILDVTQRCTLKIIPVSCEKTRVPVSRAYPVKYRKKSFK